uniref:Transcriptional repressor n=1 Tax=uncultured Elusimicrobia bacterium TaxID=699876 RepID=A0A650EP04_9BACT|nr:transcriptional repressor [uncultured Elusimicrobia bacterium]
MQNTSTTISSQELKARLDSFENECRLRGLRVTNQRREIFRAVAASREHPSAETVFLQVRRTMPNVSLDTVYRTLYSLEQMELLTRVGASSKERFDGDMRPHAHFVCTQCGEVYDIFTPQEALFNAPQEAREWGDIKRVNVQFRGICKRCRK